MTNIVNCVACKKEISNTAKVCPHCGEQNPTMTTVQILGVFAFAGFLMFLAYKFLF